MKFFVKAPGMSYYMCSIYIQLLKYKYKIIKFKETNDKLIFYFDDNIIDLSFPYEVKK